MEPLSGAPPPSSSSPSSAARRPSRRARWLGALLALAMLGGLGWLAWTLTHPAGNDGGGGGNKPGGGRRGSGTTTVGVATAERANLPVVLEALGTVMPAATVTVRPQVSGVLQQLTFREGQMVKAGELLAQIDARPFEMTLMQASGQRQRDEAQLDNARLTLARYRTLLQQDSIARQDVDTQAALVKQLEGTLVADRASEGSARLNLSYTRVVAPISGRVGLRTVDVGNVVNPGDANGLAVITQLTPIDVQFSVPQDRVPELRAQLNEAAKAGASKDQGSSSLTVTVLDRNRSTTLATGTFSALDNLVDTQTGTVRAKARFDNEMQTLFPSQFVNVRLLVRTVTQAVVVPVSALRHGANGDFVYVLEPEARTVALRPVTRGQATVDQVEIRTGLQAGEKVITEGGDRLKDGAKVALPGDAPASGPGGGNGGGRRGERRQHGAGAASGASGPGASSDANANIKADAHASAGHAGSASSPASAAFSPAADASASAPAEGASRPHRRRRNTEGASE